MSEMAELCIHDRYKGPAYAVASDEQRRFIVQVARKTGYFFDPVYTGKALFGSTGRKAARVLFLHTGGCCQGSRPGRRFRKQLS